MGWSSWSKLKYHMSMDSGCLEKKKRWRTGNQCHLLAIKGLPNRMKNLTLWTKKKKKKPNTFYNAQWCLCSGNTILHNKLRCVLLVVYLMVGPVTLIVTLRRGADYKAAYSNKIIYLWNCMNPEKSLRESTVSVLEEGGGKQKWGKPHSSHYRSRAHGHTPWPCHSGNWGNLFINSSSVKYGMLFLRILKWIDWGAVNTVHSILLGWKICKIHICNCQFSTMNK